MRARTRWFPIPAPEGPKADVKTIIRPPTLSNSRTRVCPLYSLRRCAKSLYLPPIDHVSVGAQQTVSSPDIHDRKELPHGLTGLRRAPQKSGRKYIGDPSKPRKEPSSSSGRPRQRSIFAWYPYLQNSIVLHQRSI